MTLTYLSQTKSAVIDASGNAFILFKPDTGQFWVPTLAQTSVQRNTASTTFTQNGRYTQCTLHSGSVAALTPATISQSTVKDFTSFGNGDTSSILSGTVVSWGEGILFRYSAGLSGDIAVASIIGISSDEPPTIGIVPEIPGSRFTGSTLAQPSLLELSLTTSNLTTGGGTFTAPVINMGVYESFSLNVRSSTSGVQAALQRYRVTMSWWGSPQQSNNDLVWFDSYELFAANGAGGAGNCQWGGMKLVDSCKGLYLTIVLQQTFGAATQTAVLGLIGSYRPQGRRYIRADPIGQFITNASDTGIIDLENNTAVAAGVHLTRPMPIAPGRCRIFTQSNGAGGNLTIQRVDGTLIDQVALAAGVPQTRELILPQENCIMDFQNTGGVGANLFQSIITDVTQSS